ncbi:hypothetical protein JCM10449v2_004853 [Rhodotorula kratochvilovae]
MSTAVAGDPDEPKVTGVEVERLDFAFAIDFECNLSPTTEETLYNEYMTGIPLPRKWSLEVQRGGNVIGVALEHGHLDKSAINTSYTPIPNDVRVFFPSIGETGVELWTTSHLLSSSSPYLKDLLASDFSESVKIGSKGARASPKPAPTEVRPPKDFEDSDDETDATLFEEKLPTLHDLDGLDFTYRQITVTHTAYSTYRAVLRYLETGFIRFAPLSSSCLPTNPSSRKTRVQHIQDLADDEDKDDQLPPHVSPKSVYRLAHLLRLDDLQKTCLTQLKIALTHDSAAIELFDNASVLYDDWRKVIREHVVQNWDAVTASPSWKDMQARLARDEVPGATPILLELLTARKPST